MEADDDLGQITDEIYANGDENSQRHRPIISGEQLDIEAYAALYSGRTKIARLLFIADRCNNGSMQLDALRMAYDEAKKGENTALFRDAVQKIDGRLGPSYGPDHAWSDAVDRRAELRKEKLESELNAYRNDPQRALKMTTRQTLVEIWREIIYNERIGDLSISVIKDASNASCKLDTKIDGFQATGIAKKNLIGRNLLKGITYDENTAAHDIATLGVLNVRHCGYIATVKVQGKESDKVGSLLESLELPDQPDGGANALNINSLRLLLHKTDDNKVMHSKPSEFEEIGSFRAFVKRILEESLIKLQGENIEGDSSIRWELGAFWIHHLQDQQKSKKDKRAKTTKKKKEIKDNVDGRSEKAVLPSGDSQCETDANQNQVALKSLLSDDGFTRLKESETGLHLKSVEDLIDMSQKYYNEVALPELVADFGSSALPPYEGQSLSDHMHARGLHMRSLGKVVKLSEKLPHVQSLCIHEMIVRAFKHILQAVIASVIEIEDLAAVIAVTLNMMLGVPENDESNEPHGVDPVVWRWMELFLKNRYEWDTGSLNYKDVRKYAILRGLCRKVLQNFVQDH